MRGLEQIAGHRLLFLNWRDLANPEAGGAEAYTEEIARRFAAAGAEVTLFTGKYPDAAPFDWAREYLVVRDGDGGDCCDRLALVADFAVCEQRLVAGNAEAFEMPVDIPRHIGAGDDRMDALQRFRLRRVELRDQPESTGATLNALV